MSALLSVLVLCGGQSTEHDISLLSAKNVIERLSSSTYRVSVVKISHDGVWHYFENPVNYFANKSLGTVVIKPGEKNPFSVNEKSFQVDCVFPVLHGTYGEDGTLQGMLDLLQIPYTAADCLGSAIGMDKDVLKSLLEHDHLPIVPRLFFRKSDAGEIRYHDVIKKLGSPVFIKPNSLGSAIGVKKAANEAEFHAAIADAFSYDDCILIEKAIVGREIECSVLGNDYPKVSLPGEIINHTAFYSFDAKYVDGAAATVKTPADLSTDLVKKIQELSIQAYRTLRTSGMARVDFFLENNSTLYINEINTIPGFTDISMYPKNWEASGLSYPDLLDKLIYLAMERFQSKRSLIRVYGKKTVST